jgi:hypothetical protein
MSLSFVHRRFVLLFVAIVLLHYLAFPTFRATFIDTCCSEFLFVMFQENEELVLLAANGNAILAFDINLSRKIYI